VQFANNFVLAVLKIGIQSQYSDTMVCKMIKIGNDHTMGFQITVCLIGHYILELQLVCGKQGGQFHDWRFGKRQI
jgi:hypothetical protein